jgi:lipoprotein-anchoring transpeptidase ErfK/SrfK
VNYVCIAYAGALLAAVMSVAVPSRAFAQDGWFDGNKPIFRSDVLREQQRLERERESRRRDYQVSYPPYMEGGPQPQVAPVEPPIVALSKPEPSGSIIIDTGGRRLFYVLPGNQAYQYPISVGREGFTWTGTETISRIAPWPSWNPPAEMRQRQPGLPITMTGGINNPLGATALYLGNTLYRIHGTNDPKTIGRASSSGCFRMMNGHVVHLASLAGVGTRVRVVSRY